MNMSEHKNRSRARRRTTRHHQVLWRCRYPTASDDGCPGIYLLVEATLMRQHRVLIRRFGRGASRYVCMTILAGGVPTNWREKVLNLGDRAPPPSAHTNGVMPTHECVS